MSAQARPGSGSTGDDLLLRFLFANYDGAHVVLKFHKATGVAAVKEELRRNWPDNVPPADDLKAIRLICMGRGMLQESQTLDGAGVPAFVSHPTPVNVSILRKAPAVTRGTATAASAAAAEAGAAGAQGSEPPKAAVSSSGCGCVLQ
ncbi:TPA: hypothetical protein N0F65_001135 [Lagenidium giganteum]|uniref:UBL3-like ubiquitin domain-containing protein n=1 Tax=Lagenidium giganteum TaxID=4803 RepID=A0AAV2YYR3_9STRA|nr:TPA: hypothetical protein N0F65_001135 [Lagenidium giganteum]